MTDEIDRGWTEPPQSKPVSDDEIDDLLTEIFGPESEEVGE